MRKLLLCSTTALMMGPLAATAGGLGEPIMEPDVVEKGTSSSSAGIVVPILLLILIIAAASGSSGGSSAPPP